MPLLRPDEGTSKKELFDVKQNVKGRQLDTLKTWFEAHVVFCDVLVNFLVRRHDVT